MTSIKVQCLEMWHAGQNLDSGIGDFRAQEIDPAKGLQISQVAQASVRDVSSIEIQILEIRQITQVFQAIVGK